MITVVLQNMLYIIHSQVRWSAVASSRLPSLLHAICVVVFSIIVIIVFIVSVRVILVLCCIIVHSALSENTLLASCMATSACITGIFSQSSPTP